MDILTAQSHHKTTWETSEQVLHRLPLPIQAFCSVANPGDSHGYHYGLRLAVYPERQRILSSLDLFTGFLVNSTIS